MNSPSELAARLARLQTLGAGEGVPDYVRITVDIKTAQIHSQEDRFARVRNDEAAARILESCLRDALIGCGGVFYSQHDDLLHILTSKEEYPTLYIGRSLLDAADAVIAHLEKIRPVSGHYS